MVVVSQIWIHSRRYSDFKEIKIFFKHLEEVIPHEECMLAHPANDGSFWLNLIVSLGFGEQIPIEELEAVYPLAYVCLKAKREHSQEVKIANLETT